MLPPWCARAPRAPSPSPACARKGQNGVSDPLQGREGGLGRREGTPIPAKPPRFCPTPVSRSSPAPLGKGERGMRAGEPACSQSASSSRSVSHAYPCRPAAHPQLQLTLTLCSSTSDGAEDERAGASCRPRQRHVLRRQPELRLRGGDAPARPVPAPWGGGWRQVHGGGRRDSPRCGSTKKIQFSPTVLYPSTARL